jgi:hypothetical protein
MHRSISGKSKLKAKRTFIKKGTCSRTFFHLLNKEFGHPKEEEEYALDPLAGGILQQGFQCGMLWGASMAVGAEAHRRVENKQKVTAMAIKATQHILKSFVDRTESVDCEDITNTDFSNKWSMAKYMFSGRFVSCFILAGKWAPEAIKAAAEGLSDNGSESTEQPLSCASEVIKQMGGSEEEIGMVAGFAGGLGLSGNACGALAAAIWKLALEMVRKEKQHPSYKDPLMENIVTKFYELTDYKMECKYICGQKFATLEDHTNYINSGGCEILINALAKS